MKFPSSYAEQLRARYGDEITDQIVDPGQRKSVPISEHPGQDIEFVDVGLDSTKKPIMIVPGFSGGIINYSSFVAEMATRGGRVIAPDQNRKSILKDAANKKSSLHSQACTYQAVYRAAGQEADIVAHSYGSLIFGEMLRLNPEDYKNSRVVMLAPSGSLDKQGLVAMGVQWLRMLKSESNQERPMEFPDPKGYTGRASALTLATNVPRTIREVGDLWQRRVDYEFIAQRVGSLMVMSYAEDLMFPEEALSPMLSRAVEAGHIGWISPISPEKIASGEMTYGGHGATHDDEQFNPSRSARAILQILEAV